MRYDIRLDVMLLKFQYYIIVYYYDVTYIMHIIYIFQLYIFEISIYDVNPLGEDYTNLMGES